MTEGNCSLPSMDKLENQVKKAFAKRLKQARKDAGFKAASHFASALRVEDHTYRTWERGTHCPDLTTMTRICQLLNVEPNELLPFAVRAISEGEPPSRQRARDAA